MDGWNTSFAYFWFQGVVTISLGPFMVVLKAILYLVGAWHSNQPRSPWVRFVPLFAHFFLGAEMEGVVNGEITFGSALPKL